MDVRGTMARVLMDLVPRMNAVRRTAVGAESARTGPIGRRGVATRQGHGSEAERVKNVKGREGIVVILVMRVRASILL